MLVSFLGWMFDVFDFFLLVFVLDEIVVEFYVGYIEVIFGILFMLVVWLFGVLIFGCLVDCYGCKLVLMVDVLMFLVLELVCVFVFFLMVLLVMWFLFGIVMGGEWGIGVLLVMEMVLVKVCGVVFGLL